jgi:3-dehydroquinate synthase
VSERRVRVRLGDRSYTVAIGAGLLDDVGRRVRLAVGRRRRLALVVSNPTVWALYGERLSESLAVAGFTVAVHLIGDGERFKKLGELERAVGTAAAAELERGDPVVALGGGVVGDLAGLVSALYMRGTPFVQVPTTLLAQIDSSVGGKVAVNHSAGKNLIGAFHQPVTVLADVSTLATLPARELRAGLFEAIKYGMLGDASLFSWMERRMEALRAGSPDDLARLTAVCCRIKARVVEADETEAGPRRVLNLGHTVGHALETVTRYRRLLHGEAVGYGLEAAAMLGVVLGTVSNSDAARIRRLIAKVGSRPRIDDLDPGVLVAAMRHDKKRSGGRVAFVVPVGIGAVTIRTDVDEATIRRAIEGISEQTGFWDSID